MKALAWEDEDAANLLLDALLGAHSVLQRREATSVEVADAIARDSSLKLTADEQSTTASRLALLLEVEPLAALSRALMLVLDDQTFCRARTFSDVRPVFVARSNPPEAIGAVIRHTLLLRFHVDGPETEPFSLSVDKAGLRALRDAVDRALSKDTVLRQMAEASGLRIIDVEDSH